MISPHIGPIDATDSLSFFYNAGQASREETLLVRVSTNSNVAETAAYTRIFTVAARKTATWQRRSLSLSAFAGQQVYVAFHYVSRNKRSILIDDINVLRYTSPFFLITATAHSAGTITPNGVVVVTPYTDTTFYLQAQTGYPLDSLIVDEVNHGKDSIWYKFTNVSAYHTITAYFKVKYWTLTTIVNGSGTITRTPNLASYPDGSEVELIATPANG